MHDNTWHKPSIPCDLPAGTRVRLHWGFGDTHHELTLDCKARCEASVGDRSNEFRIVALVEGSNVRWHDETGEHATGAARCSEVLLPETIAPLAPRTDWHLPPEPIDLPTGTLVRWNVTDGENAGKTFERELLEPCILTVLPNADRCSVNRRDGNKLKYLERVVGCNCQREAASFALTAHSIRLPGAAGTEELPPAEQPATEATPGDKYAQHREQLKQRLLSEGAYMFRGDLDLATINMMNFRHGSLERRRELERKLAEEMRAPTKPVAPRFPHEGRSDRVLKQGK